VNGGLPSTGRLVLKIGNPYLEGRSDRICGLLFDESIHIMPCGRKRKRHKIATHKRKKRLRKNRHKKKNR